MLSISGMHMAWALWRVAYLKDSWIAGLQQSVIIFVLCSWFLGAIFGSVVGAVLVDLYPKKIIYVRLTILYIRYTSINVPNLYSFPAIINRIAKLITSFLLYLYVQYLSNVVFLISGILFIVWYNEYSAILSGRILAGFGHGIVYVTVVTHAAENSIKHVRGIILSSINYMILLGMFVGVIIISSFAFDSYSGVNSERLIGIIAVLFTVIGFLATIFITYESVPFLLRRGAEREALTNMMKLRNEVIESAEIHRDMLETKCMINEDRSLNRNILAEGNFKPLLLMVAARIEYVATNNFAINIILALFLEISLGITAGNMLYSPMILLGVRMVAALFSMFSVYFWPRKLHLLVSGGLCGCVMFIFATFLIVMIETGLTDVYYVLGILAAFYQLFAAIGIDPMQHIFIAESFAGPKSAWSITVVTLVENVLQIVLICIFYNLFLGTGSLTFASIYVYTYFTTGAIFFVGFVLHFTLPETREMSLKEAKDVFAKRHFRGTTLPGITYS